jgi:hypothetical protein
MPMSHAYLKYAPLTYAALALLWHTILAYVSIKNMHVTYVT